MPFPVAPSILNAALTELESHRWERVIELLASPVEDLELRPDSPDWYLAAYFVLGVASVQAGRYGEAVDYLTAILDEKLEEHPFWGIDLQETDWLPSVDAYYIFDKSEGVCSSRLLPFAHDHRAEAHTERGDFASAAADLECVLSSDPSGARDAMLNYTIGLYHGFAGQFQAAVPFREVAYSSIADYCDRRLSRRYDEAASFLAKCFGAWPFMTDELLAETALLAVTAPEVCRLFGRGGCISGVRFVPRLDSPRIEALGSRGAGMGVPVAAGAG